MSAAECAKGNHDFIPIGHEMYDVEPQLPPTFNVASGQWQYPIHIADVRHYVVRACANCTKVWWQEYDPAVARALTP